MLPYQAVAMDYTGYQRQGQSGGVPGGHMAMGSLGMGVGGPPFSHSWLVPSQDLCASPYKTMPGQHQAAMQQPLEPGHVTYYYIPVIYSFKNYFI